MNRRGVVYTIVSVLLLIAITSLFFAQSRRTGHESNAAVTDRVKSVDSFIKNLESDSQRASYIAGFRTMIAMEQYVTSTGTFIANSEDVFREIFLTGNLSTEKFTIMENSTFEEYLLRVQIEAGEQGILFNASVIDVGLWQTDPWHVLVNYTLELNITDSRGTASWETTKTFTGKVPVLDLRDPIFSVGTLARVQRVIKRTNVTVFVNDIADANDTTGLMAHYNMSTYTAAGRGPSMLMRFTGNFSDSEYGFESLVDTEEIAAQGLTVNSTKSVVDYKYFSGVEADACNILGNPNLPTNIKFATEDLETYEIEGQLEYGSC